MLVTGHPASGKTQLAKRLSSDLGIAALHRDAFKEALFDTLGADDATSSKNVLGPASYALLHQACRALMAVTLPLIVDANYSVIPGRGEVLALAQTFSYRLVEIVTEAPLPVLATRFRRRIQDGSRHPGHHDSERLMEFMERIMTSYPPLNVGGPLFRIDTSQSDSSYYPELLAQIRSELDP